MEITIVYETNSNWLFEKGPNGRGEGEIDFIMQVIIQNLEVAREVILQHTWIGLNYFTHGAGIRCYIRTGISVIHPSYIDVTPELQTGVDEKEIIYMSVSKLYKSR